LPYKSYMDFNLVFACKRFAANQLLLEIRQHSTMCARVLVISKYGVDMWWENVSYTLYNVLIKRNCAAKISFLQYFDSKFDSHAGGN